MRDGSALAGNFQAGQCLEYAFQDEAGKCFTAVLSRATSYRHVVSPSRQLGTTCIFGMLVFGSGLLLFDLA